MTDHSPPNEQKAGPFLELEVGEALSERSRSRRSPLQWLCHLAGARLRNLCAFHRFVLDVTVERTAKSAEGGALSVAVHPDGASQDGLPALPRFTGMHARDCVPTAG